jgi:heat shock protein HslJ
MRRELEPASVNTHAHVQEFAFGRRRLSNRFPVALVACAALLLVAGCQEANGPEPQAQAEADPRNTSYTIEETRSRLSTAETQQRDDVAHDFEGEADPSRMTLEMHPWTWIRTAYNNDTVEEPAQKDAFTLTFRDGRVSGTTDCNDFHGAYSVDGRKIHFDDKVASTRKFCADSQEAEFLTMLQSVESYLFTGHGRLILEIQYDSGTIQFR